jgi:hypothetical protein
VELLGRGDLWMINVCKVVNDRIMDLFILFFGIIRLAASYDRLKSQRLYRHRCDMSFTACRMPGWIQINFSGYYSALWSYQGLWDTGHYNAVLHLQWLRTFLEETNLCRSPVMNIMADNQSVTYLTILGSSPVFSLLIKWRASQVLRLQEVM